MKIKDIFKIEKINDKQFMICLDSNVLAGMVQLNDTAAFIIECLKEDTTFENIVEQLVSFYEVNKEKAELDVNTIISQLKEINAIEE